VQARGGALEEAGRDRLRRLPAVLVLRHVDHPVPAGAVGRDLSVGMRRNGGLHGRRA
jgi:hypothetical protein